MGIQTPPTAILFMAGAPGGPQSISVSALQTLKYATGATAPVAPLQLRRLNSEPASSLQGHFCWAGGRSFGERPPAQRKCLNGRRGLLTAVRSFHGGTLADGLRHPPRLKSPP
ncbi:hypothetical protein NDU88_009168 [Pleurodeles waltl]|uniref:Uncharacterized protein n=1 Tax=Pleurodeles waltl TaxID=8319 RepID=A0AAV7PRC1_PLEWA|nr:hypothetical protein NDU88_009168 [Pleurodeles waltl]